MNIIREYGIAYTEFYNNYDPNYINFISLCKNGDLLIVNNKNVFIRFCPKERVIKSTTVIDKLKKIRACYEIDENKYYILESTTNRVYLLEKDILKLIFKVPENGDLLGFNISQWGIVVTTSSAKLYYYDNKCNKLGECDLKFDGIVEPIFVYQSAQNKFLITDSLTHIVREYSLDGKIVFEYGEKNNPGGELGQLFMPVCAIKLLNNNILIAELRNHRIIEVSENKEIIREYGLNGWVGSDELLWSPTVVIENINSRTIFVLESKAGLISEIHLLENVRDILFGKPIIKKSDVNFPRSCNWSDENQELLVADTGHDRIVVFNLEGKITGEIDFICNKKLWGPRCAKWVKNQILITDSRNHRVILTNKYGYASFVWELKEYDYLPESEWLQCSDLDNNLLLLASESEVIVMDSDNGELLWTSKSFDLEFKDIHYVEFSYPNITVTDTGNNRYVVIDILKSSIEMVEKVNYRNSEINLATPRQVLKHNDFHLIVDSGKSRILKVDLEKNIKEIYGGNRGLSKRKLSNPRWVCRGPRNTLFISDTDNHRILLIEEDTGG